MKIYLLAALIVLAGCTKKETPVEVPTFHSETVTAQKPAEAVLVSTEPGNYTVYRHCIDNISYLTYARHAMIVEIDQNGIPRHCK